MVFKHKRVRVDRSKIEDSDEPVEVGVKLKESSISLEDYPMHSGIVIAESPGSIQNANAPIDERKHLSAGELMKLPREERRRILAQTADKAESVYRDHPELLDFAENDEGHVLMSLNDLPLRERERLLAVCVGREWESEYGLSEEERNAVTQAQKGEALARAIAKFQKREREAKRSV